jgi:selenocysteine lyase/cysteine desulfurase
VLERKLAPRIVEAPRPANPIRWPPPARGAPMSAAYAYLDHNATSPLRPAAFDAMVEALQAGGNPSSVHRPGGARGRIDRARRQVAGWSAPCRPRVVFTSGGTEANNMALRGSGRGACWSRRSSTRAC